MGNYEFNRIINGALCAETARCARGINRFANRDRPIQSGPCKVFK